MAIPSSSIEEQKPGGSLMPAGLTDTLTRGELADLVRFLSELGKIGPYAVGQGSRRSAAGRSLQPAGASSTALIRTSLDAVVQNPGALPGSHSTPRSPAASHPTSCRPFPGQDRAARGRAAHRARGV